MSLDCRIGLSRVFFLLEYENRVNPFQLMVEIFGCLYVFNSFSICHGNQTMANISSAPAALYFHILNVIGLHYTNPYLLVFCCIMMTCMTALRDVLK